MVPLERIADLVLDGTSVAIGGTWLSSRPMAAVRELVRAGRRHLHVVSLNGTLDVDLLVGAKCCERVSFCFVSLGPFGLAPRFRNGVEAGELDADEHTGHGLTVAVEAASRGLPSLPFFGPVGSALAERYPPTADPVTGATVHVAAALPVEIAILHAEAATADGHVLLSGTVGIDVITARAADRVIVTTERVVERLPASGARYLAPADVDHVMETPLGAHPLAQAPDYAMDWRVLLAYAEAAATPDGFMRWLADDLAGDEVERRSRIDPDRLAVLRAAGAGGPLSATPAKGTSATEVV